jgi:hypothetical protein
MMALPFSSTAMQKVMLLTRSVVIMITLEAFGAGGTLLGTGRF